MPLHTGERVIATRSLAMGRVPAGTPGRVVKVGFFGSYDVYFARRGVLRDVTRDALTPTSGRPWWARGQRRRR
jgi:hypothetical protein